MTASRSEKTGEAAGGNGVGRSVFEIRPLEPDETMAVHELIARVFMRFVAPGLEREGIDEFFRFIAPQALNERLESDELILTAAKGSELAGVVAMRPPGHVSLLFVDEAYQGCGLGGKLLIKALDDFRTVHPQTKAVTVNASTNAVAFYRGMGFAPTADETVTGGIRYRPMARPVKLGN